MTTLATLKAAIADDLQAGTTFTSAIADSITSAIRFYQPNRYYFNESRSLTFATVQDQTWYATGDDADIGTIKKLDAVVLELSSLDRVLELVPPVQFELATDGGATTGEPYWYTYYDQKIGLDPIPDAVYTIRLMGLFGLAAPAADDTTGNAWMTEAFDLLRARVISDICQFKLQDFERAQMASRREMEELRRIEQETSRRRSGGRMKPTAF